MAEPRFKRYFTFICTLFLGSKATVCTSVLGASTVSNLKETNWTELRLKFETLCTRVANTWAFQPVPPAFLPYLLRFSWQFHKPSYGRKHLWVLQPLS